MRLLAGVCFFVFLTSGIHAQDSVGDGAVCRVAILQNTVDLPHERRDGLVLLRVYVATSTGCTGGQVQVAAFPAGGCRREPSTDLNNATSMTFSYKPALLDLAIQPGNINSGVIEISSDSAGTCSFNTHVASCGSVVRPGGRCVTRDLTDPQAEAQGEVTQEFNRLR